MTILLASTMDKKEVSAVTEPESLPPPSYSQDPIDITSNLRNLNLDSSSPQPTVDQVIAHLKLLYAFHQLREDVATTDGLFGIKDSLASNQQHPEQALLKVREKRWAVYVARATDRFTTWWSACVDTSQPRLRQADMLYPCAFDKITDVGAPSNISPPPLGR